jgi:uncharacterized protein with HEPN domain
MPRDRNDPARDAAWLSDMLDAARAVQTFVAGRTFEQYDADLFFRSAVERQVEILARQPAGCLTLSRTRIPRFPGGRSWRSAIDWHTNMARLTIN